MAVIPQQRAPVGPAYELAVADAHGPRVSIRASGVLGLAAHDDLSLVLGAEVDRGHPLIRLDLSRVTHVGTCCLTIFVRVHERCLAAHGLLLLEGVPDGLVQVFTIPGLERTLFLTSRPGPPAWHPELDEPADLVRVERDRLLREAPSPGAAATDDADVRRALRRVGTAARTAEPIRG